MSEQAKIRRLQYTLSIAGGAVVAFCVWSLVKIVLFLSYADKDALRSLLGINDASLETMVYVLLGIVVLVDVALRLYVGLSARAEGNGKKKSPLYLVVATVIAIANASSLGAVMLSTSLASSLLGVIVSIIIEVTAIAALVLVVYSSIRLRRKGTATGLAA